MRSAPTLNTWMMPCSSVAMIENLALVSTTCCSASAFSTVFSRDHSAGPRAVGPLARGDVAGMHETKGCVRRRLCAGAQKHDGFAQRSGAGKLRGRRMTEPAED